MGSLAVLVVTCALMRLTACSVVRTIDASELASSLVDDSRPIFVLFTKDDRSCSACFEVERHFRDAAGAFPTANVVFARVASHGSMREADKRFTFKENQKPFVRWFPCIRANKTLGCTDSDRPELRFKGFKWKRELLLWAFVSHVNELASTVVWPRLFSGKLAPEAGRIAAIDTLVKQFVRSKPNQTSILQQTTEMTKTLGGAALRSAQIYIECMQAVANKGGPFALSEERRLRRLVDSRERSRKGDDDETIVVEVRLNIWHTFALPYRSDVVPRIVHFCKTDGNPESFGLLQFLAVASAHFHIKPKTIFLWAAAEPSGKWWQRLPTSSLSLTSILVFGSVALG